MFLGIWLNQNHLYCSSQEMLLVVCVRQMHEYDLFIRNVNTPKVTIIIWKKILKKQLLSSCQIHNWITGNKILFDRKLHEIQHSHSSHEFYFQYHVCPLSSCTQLFIHRALLAVSHCCRESSAEQSLLSELENWSFQYYYPTVSSHSNTTQHTQTHTYMHSCVVLLHRDLTHLLPLPFLPM